jgi:hypothetical protein
MWCFDSSDIWDVEEEDRENILDILLLPGVDLMEALSKVEICGTEWQ